MHRCAAGAMPSDALVVFEAAGDERGLSGPGGSLARFASIQGQLDERRAGRWNEPLSTRATRGTSASRPRSIRASERSFARGPTPVGEAIRRCEEVLAETEGNRTIAGAMYHPMAHMKARQGEFEEALRLASRCRDIHRENGAMWPYWVYAEIPWDIKMLAGEPEEALEILTEGYEQIERMGETFPLAVRVVGAVALRARPVRRGRTEGAGSRRRGRRRLRPVAGHGGARAGAGAPEGTLRGGRARWRGRPSRTSREPIYSTDRTWVLMDLAEVLRLAGRPDEAMSTLPWHSRRSALFEQRAGRRLSAAHAVTELIADLAYPLPDPRTPRQGIGTLRTPRPILAA